MDGTSNGAMQWSRYDNRPERLYILILRMQWSNNAMKQYYECNEAILRMQWSNNAMKQYYNAMKQYYECNEAMISNFKNGVQ